ncbi:MAG: Hpt domain-containing protein, partial [Eubacterium sp.]|nr:Hpt domain-containing protein [Eubacterium sp.]
VLPASYISYSDAPLKPVTRRFIRPERPDGSKKDDMPVTNGTTATKFVTETVAESADDRRSGTDATTDNRLNHRTVSAPAEDRSERQEADTQEQPESGLYAALRDHGIDTKTGLDYCQDDDDLYMAILTDFAEKEPGNIAYMDECLREGRTTDYEIRVHAIKGTSRLLGAKELADKLQTLEDLASSGQASELRDAHDAVMHAYSDLAHLISDSE